MQSNAIFYLASSNSFSWITFFLTVSFIMHADWGTYDKLPRIFTFPDLHFISPKIAWTNDDLPLPTLPQTIHNCPDFNVRFLSDIWDFRDIDIERNHDFIQIVFPLDTPSNFGSHGYYVDNPKLLSILKNDDVVKNNIIKSSKWF